MKPKLTINIMDNGIITFDDIEEYSQAELFGILSMAQSTVEVLYKTKLMQTLEGVAEHMENKSKNTEQKHSHEVQ